MSETPGTIRLLQLGGGVLFFHVLNSILQEAVFHLKGFNHSIALTFLQTLGIAFFAYLELLIRNRREAGLQVESGDDEQAQTGQAEDVEASESSPTTLAVGSPMFSVVHAQSVSFERTTSCSNFGINRKVPLRTYFLLSILSTVSAVLTNEASHLLNYPTQVVFKSSKLFFVMSIRLMLRMTKKKSAAQIRSEFISCFMIVAGLVVFTYATSSKKAKPTSDVDAEANTFAVIKGVLAIIVALCCDAFLYIGEEKYCFEQHNASSGEVILFIYAFSSLNSLATLVGTGGVLSAVRFTQDHMVFPLLVAAFSACNFCGTHFLLSVVSEFDSNAAVIVTSTRKMFTVLLSFILYPKPFTLYHFLGLAAVSAGIFVYEYSRVKAKQASEAVEDTSAASNAAEVTEEGDETGMKESEPCVQVIGEK